LDAARTTSKDPAQQAAYNAEFAKAAKLLKRREAKLASYCKETGRKKLVDRVQVEGYNQSVSSKATAAAKATPQAFRQLATTSDGLQTKATAHLLEQAAKRGVDSKAINGAISAPLHVKPVKADEHGRRSQQYIGDDATVAINPDTGKVISAWKTGRQTRKKHQKE
jgi:hypothetical protein